MPHHFVNRPRLLAPGRRPASDPLHFRWEALNTVGYLLGGLLFVWGSVLFLPALSDDANLGAWLFVVGSALYLLVTGHDAIEVGKHRVALDGAPSIWERLETVSAVAYLIGTSVFVAGSICFLSSVERSDLGAWCFVFGSLLFVCGATIDVVQIVRIQRRRILQLTNLTALTFVTGSILFVVASIPYLFDFRNASDERTVDAFLAAQFVSGSALFLTGGVFNFQRARLVALDQGGR
jgi:hypothetical protein